MPSSVVMSCFRHNPSVAVMFTFVQCYWYDLSNYCDTVGCFEFNDGRSVSIKRESSGDVWRGLALVLHLAVVRRKLQHQSMLTPLSDRAIVVSFHTAGLHNRLTWKKHMSARCHRQKPESVMFDETTVTTTPITAAVADHQKSTRVPLTYSVDFWRSENCFGMSNDCRVDYTSPTWHQVRAFKLGTVVVVY